MVRELRSGRVQSSVREAWDTGSWVGQLSRSRKCAHNRQEETAPWGRNNGPQKIKKMHANRLCKQCNPSYITIFSHNARVRIRPLHRPIRVRSRRGRPSQKLPASVKGAASAGSSCEFIVKGFGLFVSLILCHTNTIYYIPRRPAASRSCSSCHTRS